MNDSPKHNSLISHATMGSQEPGWPPPLDLDAFHGLAGEIVATISPQSEADPVALLVQLLVAFGNVVGHKPHYPVEADRHTTNMFSVLVGPTSKARKGTSWGQVKRLFGIVDHDWSRERIKAGLVSGEGLVWDLRDELNASGETRDKRLLVVETEMVSVLKVIARKENTLSAMMRQAWDSGHLSTLSKNQPVVVTDAHISVIGHITRDELRRELTETESANGFANRFTWHCVTRVQLLPEGGHLDYEVLERLAVRLRSAVQFAVSVGQLTRDDAAKQLWRDIYQKLSEGAPGLFGAVTSRAEAQVTRLSCIYALLDVSSVVCEEHMRAALAVWKHAEDSAKYIFGNASGDALVDKIYHLLLASSIGLSRTDLSKALGHHARSEDIDRALLILCKQDRASMSMEKTGGRSLEWWVAKCERSEISAKSASA